MKRLFRPRCNEEANTQKPGQNSANLNKAIETVQPFCEIGYLIPVENKNKYKHWSREALSVISKRHQLSRFVRLKSSSTPR